eukprot:6141211-Prymnesium_polylepis.1
MMRIAGLVATSVRPPAQEERLWSHVEERLVDDTARARAGTRHDHTCRHTHSQAVRARAIKPANHAPGPNDPAHSGAHRAASSVPRDAPTPRHPRAPAAAAKKEPTRLDFLNRPQATH